MRIADVTEFYSPRGGVRAQLTLKGRALRDQGHHHLVIAPGIQADNRPLDMDLAGTPEASARVVQIAGPALPYDSNYQLLWRIDRVHKALEAFQPDIINVNSLYLAALAVGTSKRTVAIPKVVTWHADFVDNYLSALIPKIVPAPVTERIIGSIWKMVRHVLNRFAATFVASRTLAGKLEQHGIARIIEIPYGVNRSIFHPGARDAAVRHALVGEGKDSLLMIAAGRLSGEKDWDVVLEGFRRTKSHKRKHLVIYGDGPEGDRLRSLACPDDVTFMGFEPNRQRLAAAIASSDVFLHAGAYETYGFSVAEAIACGVPVVVPDAGAVRDLIDEGHASAYEPKSAPRFALALERVLGADFEEYRTRALEASHKIPDSQGQVLRTVEAYAALIASHEESRRGT